MGASMTSEILRAIYTDELIDAKEEKDTEDDIYASDVY